MKLREFGGVDFVESGLEPGSGVYVMCFAGPEECVHRGHVLS